jgi:diguanylate cyclase (GGDEF)-like protein
VADQNFHQSAGNTHQAPTTRPPLLGRLRIRAKLYLAFSAIAGLVIAAAIAAIFWTYDSDAELLRNLSLADFVERQSTAVELDLMTMSDAMRGYLLDPSNQAEATRKLAADNALTEVVEGLKPTLAKMPSVLRLVSAIEAYDDDVLNQTEDRLIELANQDLDAAKRYYQTDYLPQREREIELVLSLRQEVARVKEAVRVEASNAYVRQFTLGLSGTVIILFLSWLLASFSARVIGNQIRAMTSAMGKLADGDTTIEIPALDAEDEIGDMARALEIFRANLIARRQGEVTLRHTNLQFDAALNSMLQGMIVFGPDHRVQLVNGRFYALTGMAPGSIAPGLGVREMIDTTLTQGLQPGENPAEVSDSFAALLATRRSMQLEMEMGPGLFVQIAIEPMTNGGTVVTFEDVTEKRQSAEQIEFMARHDALTGLPNRRLFQEHMAALLEESEEGQRFALLCLDLDRFKEVNDTLGHPAGDELLRLVAARLQACVRDHDLIARLGGDEFAVVVRIPDGCSAIASSLASRLIDAVIPPFELHGHNIVIGMSIGIALSEPNVSGADMLKRADVALYRAKDDGGTFVFFRPGMDELLQARLGLEADLRLAVHRGEFELNYQPLYDLVQDRVTAFEALIRWNSPSRGRVQPSDFIPLAELTGLIIPIGEWVLRTACAEAVHWPEHVRVAVNISPVQIKNNDLEALVRETLELTGLPARRLELEITETVLLHDTQAVLTMLQDLHEIGVRVSMDDFGTGYSSLSYLRRFPFDRIKIDRSFIADLRGTPTGHDSVGGTSDPLSAAAKSAATIVRAIAGLGENLGISTTAEGVETAHQFVQVRQKGCTEVQGYFISPPRPAHEVPELLRRLDSTLPAIANSQNVSPQRVA